MTERELEIERLAMITDERLHFEDIAKETGKTSFTLEEIDRILLDYARSIKQHK